MWPLPPELQDRVGLFQWSAVMIGHVMQPRPALAAMVRPEITFETCASIGGFRPTFLAARRCANVRTLKPDGWTVGPPDGWTVGSGAGPTAEERGRVPAPYHRGAYTVRRRVSAEPDAPPAMRARRDLPPRAQARCGQVQHLQVSPIPSLTTRACPVLTHASVGTRVWVASDDAKAVRTLQVCDLPTRALQSRY
eukprot:1777497-Rhodomonas_salina.1